LRAIDHLAIARHQQKTLYTRLFGALDEEWTRIAWRSHGCDDPAMVTGLVRIGDFRVLAIGTQKGRCFVISSLCNFGMPQPEGYRKAMRLFKHAEKLVSPIVTLIDTPGAYPGMAAEEHNQAQAVACQFDGACRSNTVPLLLSSPVKVAQVVLWQLASPIAS